MRGRGKEGGTEALAIGEVPNPGEVRQLPRKRYATGLRTRLKRAIVSMDGSMVPGVHLESESRPLGAERIVAPFGLSLNYRAPVI
jgi:hypothetical protein